MPVAPTKPPPVVPAPYTHPLSPEDAARGFSPAWTDDMPNTMIAPSSPFTAGSLAAGSLAEDLAIDKQLAARAKKPRTP